MSTLPTARDDATPGGGERPNPKGHNAMTQTVIDMVQFALISLLAVSVYLNSRSMR